MTSGPIFFLLLCPFFKQNIQKIDLSRQKKGKPELFEVPSLDLLIHLLFELSVLRENLRPLLALKENPS